LVRKELPGGATHVVAQKLLKKDLVEECSDDRHGKKDLNPGLEKKETKKGTKGGKKKKPNGEDRAGKGKKKARGTKKSRVPSGGEGIFGKNGKGAGNKKKGTEAGVF